MIGTILMSLGAVLTLSGYVMFNKTDKPKESIEQSITKESIDAINKKKGEDFEKFIVQKFDAKLFTIKEWTGDKYVNGIYAETTQNPDLLIEFKLGKIVSQFSVECKWRNEAKQGKVKFSYKDQLERYKQYGKKQNIPVFIALGIGGTASDPNKLYMIPLDEIDTWDLKTSDLKTYEKTQGKYFLYDTKTKKLR